MPDVVDDARKYSAGTRAALFALGKGTCYFPDCPTTVVREVEGYQQIAVDIAHIKGANDTSARYDPKMTDEDRAAFNNLVLMCKPHHNLIDGSQRDKYPADVVRGWKTKHEAGIIGGAGEGITADNLEQLLENFLVTAGPFRDIAVDLQAVLWFSGNSLTMPFDALPGLLKDPEHREDRRELVTTVRNTGSADVSVTEVRLVHVLEGSGAESPLIGQNDFEFFQRLPHRLLNGDSLNWRTEAATLSWCEASLKAEGQSISEFYAKVRLATGEEFVSDRFPWSELVLLLSNT